MLIFRYLAKEIGGTFLALTVLLLFIFLSNQLVIYLQEAAHGKIPFFFILKLLLFELPMFVALLTPLGFYIALLLAYGRLYTSHEILILHASGYSPMQLLRASLMIALVVFLFIFINMTWIYPTFSKQRAQLLQTKGLEIMTQMLLPGRFQAIEEGQQIVKVETLAHAHTFAKQVFLAEEKIIDGQREWNILWANTALIKKDAPKKAAQLVLKKGQIYQGIPGHADYQVFKFGQFTKRLPAPHYNIQGNVSTFSTAELLFLISSDRNKMSELQWRLSIPFMVIGLTLIGVPLSRINPRILKYANFLPAIVIYIFYSNLLYFSRRWFVLGQTPLWLGMWWIHLVILLLAGVLIWRYITKLS